MINSGSGTAEEDLADLLDGAFEGFLEGLEAGVDLREGGPCRAFSSQSASLPLLSPSTTHESPSWLRFVPRWVAMIGSYRIDIATLCKKDAVVQCKDIVGIRACSSGQVIFRCTILLLRLLAQSTGNSNRIREDDLLRQPVIVVTTTALPVASQEVGKQVSRHSPKTLTPQLRHIVANDLGTR